MKVSDVSAYLKGIIRCQGTDKKILRDVEEVQALLVSTFSEARADDALSLYDIEQLEKLFVSRWHRVRLTEQCYTVSQADNNAYWIQLAQVLAHESLIAKHYFKILMPTVENVDEFEPVQYEHISEINLGKLLLSDDGTRLISLESALGCAKTNCGTLITYGCDSAGKEYVARVFTSNEKKRFEEFFPCLWGKYQTILSTLEDPEDRQRITKDTLLALIHLLDSSVFESGITGVYDDSENNASQRAYWQFIKFLNSLDDVEKEALMSQQITTDQGIKHTFRWIWEQAVEEEICITWLAKDIFTLVLAYAPNSVFTNTAINEWAKREGWLVDAQQTKSLCERSPFHAYSDSEDYYKARLITLFCSILQYDFPVLGSPKRVRWRDANNTVSPTASKVFMFIMNAFKQGNYRNTYYAILRKVVHPALHRSLFAHLLEPQSWLEDIYYGSLFEGITKLYSQEEMLAKVIIHLEMLSAVNFLSREKGTECEAIQLKLLSFISVYSELRGVEGQAYAYLLEYQLNEILNSRDAYNIVAPARWEVAKAKLAEITSENAHVTIKNYLVDLLINKLSLTKAPPSFFGKPYIHSARVQAKLKTVLNEHFQHFPTAVHPLLTYCFKLAIAQREVSLSEKGIQEARKFIKQIKDPTDVVHVESVPGLKL